MEAMLLALKATVLLSATLLAARVRRRAPAVTRHRLWSLAFAAVLALPPLASALPALYVPMPAGWAARPSRPETIDESRSGFTQGDPSPLKMKADTSVGRDVEKTPATVRGDTPMVVTWSNVPSLLVAGWLIGTTIAASALFVSLLAVRRLARTGEDMGDPAWRHAADALGARLGLRRPARLVVSAAVSTPMAGGVWRPVIFLPASARAWSAERRDVVLAHEIAHLAGRDPLRHVGARLAVALYWFHPLAWIAARQATVAREQACDEAVLALGTRPSAYARVLLDFAESMHPFTPTLAALPIVEPSLLETRLMAILNDDARPAMRRRMLMPAIGVTLLTLSVAAARPAAPAPAMPMKTAAAAPNVAVTAPRPSVVQADLDRDSACWWDALDGRSFSGSISNSRSGGRSVIYEQIGTRGGDRVIQKSFGDLRLCMLAEELGDRTNTGRPSQWLGRARRIVMEARRGDVVQRFEVGQQAGGGLRTSWRVGGVERPVDAAAERWRDRLLAVLDTIWDLSMLRGEVSTLRGEISSIRGEESSIRGEISSLRGEVSSMRGRMSSTRGEESSLRGEISSIRGHLSSLRGEISSEQGAISSLNGSRYRATDAELRQIAASITRHEANIAGIEQVIRDYGADARIASKEREIQALDANGKVAAIEAEIRAFDLDGKVAAAERRIAALDVQGKIVAIERQIAALDADRRGRQLEERRDAALKQLEAAIAAIR
jgi:beta-lactamase regulating signal transducer with metallopeptidase domain/predicted nuclease with TOPRIM domain